MKFLKWLFITGWFVGVMVICAYMTGFHLGSFKLSALQLPRFEHQNQQAVSRHVEVFHILKKGCGCSDRVRASLMTRTPLVEAFEHVLFIGTPDEQEESELLELKKAGFQTRTVDQNYADTELRVSASPLLAMYREGKDLAYFGGYSERKSNSAFEDKNLILQVASGLNPEPFPVFGCAVSRSLSKGIDPFKLKELWL